MILLSNILKSFLDHVPTHLCKAAHFFLVLLSPTPFFALLCFPSPVSDRMGVDVPDGARIVLFQEDKFKNYHNELHWALSEYDKVVSKVIPVTALVLRPHFRYGPFILLK